MNNKMYYVKKNDKSVTVLLKEVKASNYKYLAEQYINGDKTSQFGALDLPMEFLEVKEMTQEILTAFDELGFKGVSPAKLIELNDTEKYPTFRFKKDKDNQPTNIVQVAINHKGNSKKEFFYFCKGKDESGKMQFEPFLDTTIIGRHLWNVELELRPYTDKSGDNTFYAICHRIVWAKKRDDLVEYCNDGAFAEFFGDDANIPIIEPLASVKKVDEPLGF